MRWFRLFILLLFGLLAFSIACSITVPGSQTEPDTMATEVAQAVASTQTAEALNTPILFPPPTQIPSPILTATPTPMPPTATATPIPTSTPTVDEIKVTVPADENKGWVDTGIAVDTGQHLTFLASGEVNLEITNPDTPHTGPNGYLNSPCQPIDNSECLMYRVPFGKLIAKIGDNEPFEVGMSREISAPVSGKLYLSINDIEAYFYDNAGAYEVVITLTSPCHPAPPIYDDFDCLAFDGGWNEENWDYLANPAGPTTVEQNNGFVTLSRQAPEFGGLKIERLKINEIDFVEAKLMLDKNIEASLGLIDIGMWFDPEWVACGITGRKESNQAWARCMMFNGVETVETNTVSVPYNSWHTLRLEVNPETATVSLFVDEKQFDQTYTHLDPAAFRQADFALHLKVVSVDGDGGLVTGYIDDVRISQFGQQ